MPIDVTLFNDSACPWGYSASPALAVLHWRYGPQLAWRLVTIGLTESSQQYVDRGYTPLTMARGSLRFRRYGMPFAPLPKSHVAGTARACRAIVATRLASPEHEWAVMRALQFANFTTDLVLDDDGGLLAPLGAIEGLDAERVVASLDDPEVSAAYEADRAEARTAVGSASELQGKTAQTDGPVRYTAPSLIFQLGERRLEAGGFQPVEAYDVLIANLDPSIERTPPPDGPLAVLERFPEGLATQEIAAILARGNDAPDRVATEAALLELAAEGGADRTQLGDDALWRLARVPAVAAS